MGDLSRAPRRFRYLERLLGRDAQPAFQERHAQHVAQTLATGRVAIERGDVTFRFVNSWNYTVGNYTQTITFTLSSP